MEMVGMMAGVVLAAAGAGGLREQAVAYLNEAKIQGDTSAKIDTLKRVKEIVLYRDPSLLPEFVPHLMELQTELASPIRKCLAEIIEEIGLKRSEHIPLMVPVLLALFRDETPVVARRAMATGSNLFRSTLEQVAYQGIYTGNVEKWLEDSWLWMTRLKDAIYSAAQQHGNDGVRFVAVKFVETAILLFTPDPEGPSQPPPLQQNTDEIVRGFNVTWIIGGHPVLDAGVLGQEASRNLSLLLDQLRTSEISKLSGPVAIVLVNSLAAIAKKRPSLYGRILPVLLGLGPNCEAIKGAQVSSVVHALKNAFLFLLKCTHSGAAPWRERLVSALRAMNAGDGAEAAIRQADRMLRNAEKERAFRDSRSIKDERMPSSMPPSFADSVRKRPIPQENGNQANDVDDSLSKRVRPMSSAALMAPSFQQPQSIMNAVQDPGGPSGENSTGAVAMDSAELSPLQQMIAVIGALVAKGERAAASIDLLITSLPADTLADIVIENMRNLPATAPPLPASVATGGSTVVTPQPTSAGFITPVVPSVPTAAASASEGNTAVQAPSEHRRDLRRDPRRMDPRRVAVPVGVPQTPVGVSDTLLKTEELGIEVSGGASSSVAVKTEGLIVLNNRESQGAEQSSCIPGISEFASIQVKVEKPEEPLMPDIVSSAVTAALLQFTTPPLTSGQQITALPTSVSSCSGSVVTVATGDPPVLASANDSIPSVPVVSVKSEQGLPSVISAPALKETQVLLPGAVPGGTSLGVSSAIPIVHLSDDQQLRLSKAALVRILEGYKPIDAAGGGELRIALLARLIAQSHTDEEIWGVLQKHILADYQNQKGHELAIHTLYQLYAEQMSVVDGSGTIAVAATAYEKFLLSVAQGLRDNLPPSDKSLSRLLGEAPVLSEETLKLLEALCNPEVKEGSETPSGDRITQGLSAFWSLILLRPPTRAACLDIVLQCAVHELDEVRTKAIRLVANKLYPISYVSQNIEDFATKMVHSVVETRSNEEGLKDAMESDEATTHLQPAEKHEVLKQKPSNGDQNVAGASTGADGTIVEEEQHRISRNPVSLAEAQRCMSLYFALCTKKHSLLGQLFIVYGRAPKGVKQAVHRHMPVLIRTIGSSSPDLLQIISDPPVGSKNLLLQVLHILTESSTPSPELIASVKQLYETKLKDAGILIPILSCLSKDEVLPIFPRLVDLPTETFKAALARILQGSVHTGPALTPAEVLIAIHGIDPERDSVSLAKVKDACSVCFQQRTVFTQQVLAKVLNQLVEQTPLPMLFMRTVIQAVGAFRSLVNFVMEILSRLVSKQIWKSPNLWVGFLKCADQTQPHSFHVLLQLPAVQLEKALHKHPNLRSPLTTHASQTNIRSTLPRATLVVLGLAQDAPPTESSVQNQSTADNAPTPPAPQGMQAVESVPIT